MKRIKAGKLVFEREVLRRLSSGDLGQVHGAGKTYVNCTGNTGNNCNPTQGCPYTAKNGCGPTEETCVSDCGTCFCPVMTNAGCGVFDPG